MGGLELIAVETPGERSRSLRSEALLGLHMQVTTRTGTTSKGSERFVGIPRALRRKHCVALVAAGGAAREPICTRQ